MVSQLSRDIVGAVLTAPSREQCWLCLPHQRVQQVPLFFLHKALVLGTWFLVKRQVFTECPPCESACSLPGYSFPSELSAPFALLAILQLSRAWGGMSYVCFVFASDLDRVLLNGHVQGWLKNRQEQTWPPSCLFGGLSCRS